MAGTGQLVGLGKDRAGYLIDVLELHSRWLQEANNDARHAILFGGLPEYLVDFEILYAYAFSSQRTPSAASGPDYLLWHTDTPHWIGPGTALEMLETVNEVFESRAATLALTELRKRAGSGRADIAAPLSEVVRRASDLLVATGSEEQGGGPFAIYLLSQLAQTGRLEMLDLPTDALDFDLVRSLALSLDALRPRYTHSNFADALNYAAVLSCRSRRLDSDSDRALFLLTNSQPLFNERLLPSPGTASHPISRDVSTALYSAMAFAYTETAEELAERTLDQSVKAAQLRPRLIREELQGGPAAHVSEHDLARAVATNAIQPSTREALAHLAELLSDPIVMRTQEVFDDINLVTANIGKQRGEYEGMVASSTRLMDMLIEFGELVKASVEAVMPATSAALERHDQDFPGYSRRTIYPRERPAGEPLVTIERHDGSRSPAGFIANWPAGQDAEGILDAMNNSYAHHGIERGVATFGFQAGHGQAAWEVSFPLEMADLANVARKEEELIWWIRLDAEGSFSLFADLVAGESNLSSMIVGVGGEHLNPSHLADLHAQTSSRYVLAEWLIGEFESFGITVGS